MRSERRGARGEGQGALLLKLPPQVAASDEALHSVAARIFCLAPVRSVTVDNCRTAAIVRLKPGAEVDAAGEAIEEAVSNLLCESVAVPVGEQEKPVELLSWTDPADESTSFITMPGRVTGWRKSLYLLLATLFLLLGLAGVVLPGLPTTPFVLLASYYLVRSSTTLHERLMASRLFGGMLRDWYVHRGLRPHVRTRAVAVVALVAVVSLAVARPPWPVMLAIVALVSCGLFVIWRLPSVRETKV